MGLTGKLILPLVGVVLLCGLAMAGIPGYDDVNRLPPEEKRRIIRELLRAQKDIRRALLKVHYSLNGEELEEEKDDYWYGCWDKELPGFRATLEERMNWLANSLKVSNALMDEIDERIKPGHYGGHYESGYGGPSYGGGDGGSYGGHHGEHGYGPGYGPSYGPVKPKPTHPPITTTYETTSWRPTTEGYKPDDDDNYYLRNRGANRRYGRELNVDAVEGQEVKHESTATEEKPVQPELESEVVKALDTLVDDKE